MESSAKPLPTESEAEELLEWAVGLNPGAWGDHSRNVAKAARTIASNCALDGSKAYILGLLHDIGRYEGVRGLHHVIAGYDLLMAKGFPEAARICVTHSFQLPELQSYGGGAMDCNDREIAVIKSIINDTVDDYDRLIQLCDAFASAGGIVTIEARVLDVTIRYGFNEFSLRKWQAIFQLKKRFDELCGRNIYGYFLDDIMDSLMK